MRFYTLVLTFVLCVAYVIAEKSALEVVSDSTIPFSVNFFKEIAKNNERNFICSSLSVQLILSMLAYGAKGNTAVQMRNSLNLPAENNLALQGFHDLIKELNNVGNASLEVANKLYVAKSHEVKPEYKNLTKTSFLSEIAFLDIDNPQAAAREINNWVNEKTQQKIQEIVESKEINNDTRIMLLNAVYFKGKWANGFNKKHTGDKTFNYMENNVAMKKLVPTMFNVAEYLHGELSDLNAKFIQLPYQNSGLKMLIIVPKEVNGLSQIERNLESFNYNSLRKAMYNQKLKLYLPKFKIKKEFDLNPVLKKLGMTEMLTEAADFTGISYRRLMINVVRQKAFIDVNEEGTEAAAVTYGHLKLSPAPPPIPPPEFNVDKPFIFKILTNTNLELFSGVVKNL